jgi:hypothetical protein
VNVCTIRSGRTSWKQPWNPYSTPPTVLTYRQLPPVRASQCSIRVSVRNSTGHISAGQPTDQPVLVTDGELPEAERRANLLTVVLHRTTRPRILRDRDRIDFHLLGRIHHRSLRNLLRTARKSSFLLEEFQQQTEPDPGSSGLVPTSRQSLPISVHAPIKSSGDHS